MFGLGMNPLLGNQPGQPAAGAAFAPQMNGGLGGVNQFQLMAAAQMLQSQLQNRKPQNSFQQTQ